METTQNINTIESIEDNISELETSKKIKYPVKLKYL